MKPLNYYINPSTNLSASFNQAVDLNVQRSCLIEWVLRVAATSSWGGIRKATAKR
jgi:hypothetical protein